jgi:hypothetical protein
MSRRSTCTLFSLLLLACSSSPSTPADGADVGSSGIDLAGAERAALTEAGLPKGDRSLHDAGRSEKGHVHEAGSTGDAGGGGLPFTYTRTSVGTPVSAADLTAITDKYIDLLKKTRYFDVLDERVHGWPQSDSKKRYWYGTWWSGVGIEKASGSVSYVHVDVGADNNGLRTGPLLEGTCFATKLWGTSTLDLLTRRLIRGFNSWILAMERKTNDPYSPLLARVGYPEPITSTDGGRSIYIDYSADRPGVDSYTQYVHLSANPTWGDVYIKNNRSKDDISHMVRAMATLYDCASVLGTSTQADNKAMQANYVKWAKRVETDSWTIATLDTTATLTYPSLTSTMSHYYSTGNAECNAMLSLKLFSQATAGSFSCSNGIHPLEFLALKTEHNGEIIRSYHEAAVKQALLAGKNTIAQTMLPGLAKRIEEGITYADSGTMPAWLTTKELSDLIIHSANTGVPLTWKEVRFLHDQIEAAYTSYVTNADPAIYSIFDSSTPDGSYSFEPSGDGLNWTSLALLIGTCDATYRNPSSKPVLDCSRLATYAP